MIGWSWSRAERAVESWPLGVIVVKRYVVRRLLSMVVVLAGLILLVFLSLHLAPGDPVDLLIPMDMAGDVGREVAERLRAEHGLDDPLVVQFGRYISQLSRLDLGRSITDRRPIAQELTRRMPATMQLGVMAMLIGLLTGIPAGVVSALRRSTYVDNLVMFFALSGVSFPGFFLGTVLILVFGLLWPILPPSGYARASLLTWEGFRYLIMPSVTLATGIAAVMARLTRSSMLDVLKEDYVRTARAKGLSESVVVYKHAFRNSLIPVVTVLGLQIGYMMGGAVIVETVFSWPGIGRYMVGALVGRDYPVVQGCVLVFASLFVFVVFLTDLSYAVIDPRVRYS